MSLSRLTRQLWLLTREREDSQSDERLGLVLPLVVSDVEQSSHHPGHCQHQQQAHRHQELGPGGYGGREGGGGRVDWFTEIIFIKSPESPESSVTTYAVMM